MTHSALLRLGRDNFGGLNGLGLSLLDLLDETLLVVLVLLDVRLRDDVTLRVGQCAVVVDRAGRDEGAVLLRLGLRVLLRTEFRHDGIPLLGVWCWLGLGQVTV